MANERETRRVYRRYATSGWESLETTQAKTEDGRWVDVPGLEVPLDEETTTGELLESYVVGTEVHDEYTDGEWYMGH